MKVWRHGRRSLTTAMGWVMVSGREAAFASNGGGGATAKSSRERVSGMDLTLGWPQRDYGRLFHGITSITKRNAAAGYGPTRETAMFEPAQLRSFLAVAETLSFTKAAERLGLAQPTVSQHVRKLETAAKRVLIARDTRDVRLTDNGDAMAGFARSILAAHDAASPLFLRLGHARPAALRHGRRPRHHRAAADPPGVPADLSADQPRTDGGPKRPALQAAQRRASWTWSL